VVKTNCIYQMGEVQTLLRKIRSHGGMGICISSVTKYGILGMPSTACCEIL
jgi:hypothetical protein